MTTVEIEIYNEVTTVEVTGVSASYTTEIELLKLALISIFKEWRVATSQPDATFADFLAVLQGGDGQSAYDGAVAQGYTGTETQFYTDLANISTAISNAAAALTAANSANALAATKENSGVAQSLINQLINGATTEGDNLKLLEDRLKACEAIIGDASGDDNNIVDTVRELLAVFENFPESTDIVSVLAAKCNISDIYNALDCIVSGKTLDARQGKVLSDAIAILTTAVSTKLTDPTASVTTIADTDYLAVKSGSTWYSILFSNVKTLLANTFAKLSGGNTFTGVQIMATVQSDNYQDTAGNTPFLTSNPNVFYYNIKAFTPAYSLTVSADGTYVTAAGASFTAGTLMQQARLTVNGVNRVISSSVSLTTTVAYVTSAFPSSMWGQTYTSSDWGVYAMEWLSSGIVNYISSVYTVYNVFFFYTCKPVSYVNVNGDIIYTANYADGVHFGATYFKMAYSADNLMGVSSRLNKIVNDGLGYYAFSDLWLRALKLSPVDVTYLTIATTAGSTTTLTVADTTQFPASGTVTVGSSTFVYTSKTSTTLVGSSQTITANAIGTEVILTVGTASFVDRPRSIQVRGDVPYWINASGVAISLI